MKQILQNLKNGSTTLETVFKRLDEPLPLGYSNVGIIKKAERGTARRR